MLYSTFISQLRQQVGDVKRPAPNVWTGDGATTTFYMAADTFPVYDGVNSYVVKVEGVTKAEVTDYTLDKSAGILTFLSAPSNGAAVRIDSFAVHLLDSDWLSIINNTIRSLGDDFWKEFLDSTTFTTTANMLSLSLASGQANCIAVYELSYRRSIAEDWQKVENFVNWRYDRENNVLYFGRRDAFTAAGELLRVRGLKTFTLGSAITDTIDVQDKFLTIVEFGTLSRYWQWRYKDVVELVSKMTQESSRTPLQELMMLADRFSRQYETEKAKLKPMKPPRVIPQHLNNGGVA